MDGHRALASVARRDEAELAPSLGLGERLLLVPRRVARPIGDDPDLEKVNALLVRGVLLAVRDAGARRHALDLARPDDGAGAHAVRVRELAVEDVRENFHVAVTVLAEAVSGRHAVLVDHAEAAKAHVRGVVVVGEREGVEALEPTVIGVAAIGGATDFHDERSLVGGRPGAASSHHRHAAAPARPPARRWKNDERRGLIAEWLHARGRSSRVCSSSGAETIRPPVVRKRRSGCR